MNLKKLQKNLSKGEDRFNQRGIDQVIGSYVKNNAYKLRFRRMITRMQAKEQSKLTHNELYDK